MNDRLRRESLSPDSDLRQRIYASVDGVRFAPNELVFSRFRP
jgi:hypothetical protein